MELMELYNQIENPIDNPKVIEKLITVYANSSKGLGGFYGQLTKTVSKEYNKGEYYQKDADRFYAMMFNKWKNSIVAMTKDEFVELYKQGSYDQDFIKMRNYLRTVPDVSTMQEANDIFFSKKGDNDLEDALEKYRWTAFGSGSGWVHVCSRYVTAKKDQYLNVEHRLYLDTESLDTYKMITYLVEKCDEHHLPYYFKFDQFANRDDTIVIYSDTENLTKYVEILQEIKRDYPELVARTKEPPLLTGKIDGWIGYGSEPEKTPDGKLHSFNEVRTSVLESAIAQVTKNWIMNHRDMLINYQGQKVKFQDYITMKATESLISNLENKFISHEKIDKKIAQNNHKTYNQVSVIDRLGYTLQDVKSPQFKQSIYKILSERMEISLANVCNGSYKNMAPIVISVRNGRQISFKGYDLEKVIQELAPTIARNDSNFTLSVQEKIKNKATQYGIDVDKFCFDIKARETMKKRAAQFAKINQQEQNIDLETLDIQTLPQIINPELMKKTMRLPNGAEIPAKQYIQEIVYPQLPSTGIIILANGLVLPIKQFIEEYVMFECQEKYNGDFPRYMVENTRNNMGVISIESKGERYEINPLEITDFINPTLLEQKMQLPNGTEISARQYIQELFAPHIPISGRITLNNGVDIPVKQYIEEILMGEGQEKYNGDISQILFNTTRNNIGFINTDIEKIQEILMQLRNPAVAINQDTTMESGTKRT